MKSISRRLAAAVLSLAVVLSMMPAAGFTAWADDSEKDIVAEETSNETVSNDQKGDLQLEGEEESLPDSKMNVKIAEDAENAEVSLGDDIELNSLIVGYTSEQAEANTGTIALENTGNCEVTIYPDKLSFSNTKFKWTKLLKEEKTLQPGEKVDVFTVQPKAGLAADWYYGYVYYRDYDSEDYLYSRTMVYLAVLKDGLSLDVYDEDDKDITLFDLGASVRGSSREVSQEFWVTNDGNEPFRLSFTSTNDLFKVEQKTKQELIEKDDDVLCKITVDPSKIAGLAVGTYEGYVTAKATAEGGKVAEETIPVTYKVTEEPKWSTLEASDIRQADEYISYIPLSIENMDAFYNAEEDYIKPVLTEGDQDFEMSDYVYSDHVNLRLKNGYTLDKGVYNVKIKLLYDPTGQADFSEDHAKDLGTMSFTLNVVEPGTFKLSLVNKEYDPDAEILDLGVLTTGYSEEQAIAKGIKLKFKNEGKEDLEVSGKGFGCYYSENGEDFVWTEDGAAATLKPNDEYDEITIRPAAGKKAGLYYDYFYLEDDNNRCYAEFAVSYLVADKGQTMRVVDSGGLFGKSKEIENGDSAVFDTSHTSATSKKYYKWIHIYNTGKKTFYLKVEIPEGGDHDGLYSYSSQAKDKFVEVEPGDDRLLTIVLDTTSIAGNKGSYDGKFKIVIKDENEENTQTRTIPVEYTITDKSYKVSLDMQGKGAYGKDKVEADFPEGTTYRSAVSQLNSEIVGDTSNLWPVDDEYAVVAFTKNKDGAYSSWDELIEAQKQVSDQVIKEDTELYVNWAKKIKTADVTAKLPVCGTTAGTAVAASVDKDAPYTISSVSWKGMDDKDVLEYDSGYPLEVNLDAAFGYAFAKDSSVKINGVFAARTSSSNSVSYATANRVVMINEHDWDEGKVTKEATVDSEGVKIFTCRHCKKTKKEVIPKTDIPESDISDGKTYSTDAGTVKIISKENMTAAFEKPVSNKKSVTVPATVNVGGKTFYITAIGAGAFKGTKTTTLTVKSKKLTKKSVKGSLKGSRIKTVKVKVGKKKDNKKYVKKYKKIFTKKNAGRKVKVK